MGEEATRSNYFDEANPVSPSPPGCVYIVGAGPGAIAYLTVQAQAVLAQAEVLVTDALIDPAVLDQLAPACEVIQVGKRGGQPSTPQTEINQILVQLCRQGKQVVRLKSGDPFIYGRTTSEIQALQAAGCGFVCLPGLSSVLSAPTLAGIPLTDPVLSQGFTVTTGHAPDELDWETLARSETLVILMGTRSLPTIVAQLQRYDVPSDRPIAVIQWAGQPRQRVWVSTLAQVLTDTAGIRLSPSVIVIGEVVRLRDLLRSPAPIPPLPDLFTTTATATRLPMTAGSTASTPLPLAGLTVLVTRAAGQSSAFRQLLSDRGATVLELPTLDITPPSSWHDLDRAIANLQEFDWLILTSANGVEGFWQRLLHSGGDGRSLAGIKIAVVGKKTARSLTERGIQPDFIPPNFVADDLAATLPVPAMTDIRILFPRVETGGRDVLVRELSDRGATVTEVAAYESRCPDAFDPAIAQAIRQGQVDVLTFASSKTVRHFGTLLHQLPDAAELRHALANTAIASIGPQTSATCYDLWGRVDIEATEYTLDGLTAAIVAWAGDR